MSTHNICLRREINKKNHFGDALLTWIYVESQNLVFVENVVILSSVKTISIINRLLINRSLDI